jgi:hypothetical protein
MPPGWEEDLDAAVAAAGGAQQMFWEDALVSAVAEDYTYTWEDQLAASVMHTRPPRSASPQPRRGGCESCPPPQLTACSMFRTLLV